MGAWSGEDQPWRAAYSRPEFTAETAPAAEAVVTDPLALEPPTAITFSELERVRPWIEAALAHGNGTHVFLDVIQEVSENRATLWIFERSAVVTQTVAHPRAKVITFWLAGGDMEELLSREPGILAWAKRDGCTQAAVIGRKGWLRSLAPFGYTPSFYCTLKEIL